MRARHWLWDVEFDCDDSKYLAQPIATFAPRVAKAHCSPRKTLSAVLFGPAVGLKAEPGWRAVALHPV